MSNRTWTIFSRTLLIFGACLVGIQLYKIATDDCTERGGVRVQGACIDKAVLR